MRAVHRVTRLEGRHGFPVFIRKDFTRLRRRLVNIRIQRWELAFAQDLYATCDVDVILAQHLLYAWMLRIGGGEDLLALVLFINGIGFFDRQHTHDFAILCDQGNFVIGV